VFLLYRCRLPGNWSFVPPARSRCNSPHSPESLLPTTHDCATAFFLEFSCGKEEEEEGKKGYNNRDCGEQIVCDVPRNSKLSSCQLGKKKTNQIQLWCTLEELKNLAEFLLLFFDREWCTLVDDLRVSTEDCCDTVVAVATIGVLFCFYFFLSFVCLFVCLFLWVI
jgi:hypothetical protein